jgi:hypothetical protein
MSDGRIFTDWRTAGRMNYELAKQIKIPNSLSQTYSEILQSSNGASRERMRIESDSITGDMWGRQYTPPPPKQLIVPEKRQGVEILYQDLPHSIGAEVQSGNIRSVSESRPGRPSQGNTFVSDCGIPIMSRNDPRWGISPETLVLNLRNSTPGGGSTTGWINDSLHDLRH